MEKQKNDLLNKGIDIESVIKKKKIFVLSSEISLIYSLTMIYVD